MVCFAVHKTEIQALLNTILISALITHITITQSETLKKPFQSIYCCYCTDFQRTVVRQQFDKWYNWKDIGYQWERERDSVAHLPPAHITHLNRYLDGWFKMFFFLQFLKVVVNQREFTRQDLIHRWFILSIREKEKWRGKKKYRNQNKNQKREKNVRYGENNKRSICDPFIMKIKWISKSLTNHNLFYPR